MSKEFDSQVNTIICGDCLEVMKDWPDGVIDCCVTSPPYWGLRDYGVAGQLGLEKSLEEYVVKMIEVFREVRRVLKPEGTLFLNLGDSYFGGGRGGGGSFSSERPGWREIPCGTSGKEPANSQGRDCLCENLCDACRLVYQSHRLRNDGLLVAMLSASLSLPIPERKESGNGHSPTLDFSVLENHILAAIQHFGNYQSLADEQLLSLRESMPDEFSRQLLDGCWQRGSVSSCLLCGRSSASYAPASEHKTVCTCGTEENGHPSGYYKSDIASLRKAYPHYTITHPASQTLKPKDLCGIPWRVAFALQADGWWLRQDIIWHKPNPMPESVTDRCTKAHEYLFLLTKSPRYFYDADAIREPIQLSPEAYKRKYKMKNPTAKGSALESGAGSKKDGFNKYLVGKEIYVPSGRNKRSVWTVATAPYSDAHFATFPPKLIEPCIKVGCPKQICKKCGEPRRRIIENQSSKRYATGKSETKNKAGLVTAFSGYEDGSSCPVHITTGWTDCGCGEGFSPGIVLDPFGGVATTALVAYKNLCDYVMIELSPEYAKMGKLRLKKEKDNFGLFENNTCQAGTI
ncbi:hypothetical protein LCGC14_0434170 [marine sediment metagenome]|uniref:site-specific DNA-methyltransferase (cytosine-N(4)-specific) n=1 Tax=marine sediment metagenome TaxID=412755 RepID=A0A0F9T587_9ZZZZ